MSVGGIVGVCIGAAVVALLAFMFLRTAFTRPVKKNIESIEKEPINEKVAAEHLSEAIKIPTVSVPGDEGDFSAFDKYREFLAKTYPCVHENSEITVINNHSLIFKIKGKNEELLPACFLSHQDVVPVTAEEWSVEPFGGVIKDGYVYGRGALDMKGHMIALLEGLEAILARKKVPERTIYLCFGHDEEITGINGACKIVDYLYEQGISMEYVVDEGGVIIDGRSVGVRQKVAVIGTSEKGYADFMLSANKDGGHASSPKRRSSVDAVCEAVYYLSHMPMKAYWSKPAKETIKTLSPYMPFAFKFLFVNRDILSPILKFAMCKVSPLTNSLMRTTFAFTELKGSDAANIIPNKASAVVNVRINLGQSVAEVKKYMQKVAGKDVKVEEIGRTFEPVISGDSKNAWYKEIERAIDEVFGYVTAPYPFIAASDAKYYNKISKNVFRFGPLEMEEDDQSRIHSKDERCKIDSLTHGAQFFARFIENTCY